MTLTAANPDNLFFNIYTMVIQAHICVTSENTKDSQYMSEERSIAYNMQLVYTVARQVHDHIIWDPFKGV